MSDVDPQEWEEDQLQKLSNAAKKYGWDASNPQYKARLKLIQKQTLQRMQSALGAAAMRAPARPAKVLTGASSRVQAETKRPQVGPWKSLPEQKWGRYKSFASDKALLGVAPYSSWVTDRDSPGSKKWRRYISIDQQSGMFVRKRLLQHPGERH